MFLAYLTETSFVHFGRASVALQIVITVVSQEINFIHFPLHLDVSVGPPLCAAF